MRNLRKLKGLEVRRLMFKEKEVLEKRGRNKVKTQNYIFKWSHEAPKLCVSNLLQGT